MKESMQGGVWGSQKTDGLSRMHRQVTRLFLMVGMLAMLGPAGMTQVNVLTQHNDIARTGSNANETILTPANVNTSTFGKLFSQPVDGYVYAQNLYMSGVTMGAGTSQAGTVHNVLFVATEHDTVYAFDADSNGGANGLPLWKASLTDAAHGAGAGATSVPNGDVGTADLVPELGITGTPVIDPTTSTMYVVSKTKESGVYFQRLHALDITTGLEKFNGPRAITGSVAGTGNGSSGGVLNFDPKWQNQRASLLLLNGIVYITYASHGDNGPWHGWLFGYNATTLQQTGFWCSSPNTFGSGIWMGGTGLAADVPAGKPFGRIFTVTGNGLFQASPPYTNAMEYGDSFVTLDLTNGVPTVTDDFTPFDQAALNGADEDQASGGVVVLPDAVGGGGGKHQLIQLGKSGRVYVLDRENLGGYSPNNTSDPQAKTVISNGLWGAPAYWNGNVYFWARNNILRAFSYANGGLTSPNPTSNSVESAATYSPTPSVSANGNTNGIVWSIKTDTFNLNPPTATLYAHDATNVATLLYSSDTNLTRDNPGKSVKFVTPTIANGKVYVGAQGQVSVFGLLNGVTQAAAPIINPVGQTFTTPLQITITDTTAGAAIYYTTDGSTPTTSSSLYTGPITVNTTETISAIASATGFLQSPVSSQSYISQTQTLAPTFIPLPTNYQTPQTITISDATPGSTIYYTVDGSTPSPGVGSTLLYTAPFTITATTNIKAMATSTTLTPSLVSSALYTISSPGTTINFSAGFSNAPATMTFNGSTGLDDTRLQLTSGLTNQAGSAFNNTPVNIQAFTSDFTFQLSNAGGDGITFTIQGNAPTALGPLGGGLGYGPDTPGGTGGIPKSVAIKFDTYSNQGEGQNSTGLYLNGASPTIPAIDLTPSGIDLHSGSTFAAHLVYDGTTLSLTLNDPVSLKTFAASWPVDIPGTIGGTTAYAGFTGGTGGVTSSQKIGSWTFFSTISQITATPTFSPAAGIYLGTQTVTLSDSTSGAIIYYTTDGTTPTTSSTKYTAPLTVTATQTINAMGAAAGYSNSPVASAAYTIESQVAAPTFSPIAGTYSTPQTVTISSATTGATIYYTTNGTTPTTSSTVYSAPITVSSTTTVQAIATKSGFFNSSVASATYTITSSGVTSVNLGTGFTAGAMLFNGSAKLNGTRLRVTDGGGSEASSAWYSAPVNIQQFTNDFSFQITGGTNPTGDGFAFVIQGGASTAIGPAGGGLGYGPDNTVNPSSSPNPPITKSVAIKFDLYSNAGEGTNSTGLYVNGASPTMPTVDLSSSGINLHSTDVFNVHMNYDGANLTMTITDATTNAKFTNVWPINIPGTVGGTAAYVGFTGGSGGVTAIQEVIGWTMASNLGITATPTFSPGAGTYTSTQNVTISDATNGATIYYTTDGTTPTAASTKYTGPLTVATTQTVNAIATAAGFSNSAIATATYTIQTQAAAPTFTPLAGTYSIPQTVSISSATAGATIYYTTNGTTPTTASTVYTAPIAVNATTTVQAIAAKSGFLTSGVSSATYTITSSGVTIVNLGNGFTSGAMILNGNASLNGTRLRITDGGGSEASSAWYNTPVNIQQFTTNFSFQVTGGTIPTGDGFAFVIQGGAPNAIGPGGGGLGYGPDNTVNPSVSPNAPIAKSVAIKFDLYSNAGESADSTGLYVNGASPTMPAMDMTSSGVNLHTTDVFNVRLTYDGTNLSMTITDATTNATFTNVWPINLTSTVGSNAAYIGFTGGTGGATAIQEIISLTMTSSLSAAATPAFSPGAGSYGSAQSVTISDTTSGAAIYYTTDGTTPTAASTKYTGPVSVAASQTLSAIAVASGFSNSAVATAAYIITPTSSVNYGSGFTASGLVLRGSTALSGTRLRLTNTSGNQAGSAWYATPVNVQTLTTDFTFQIANPTANPIGNGITFVIQNAGTTALGPKGGGLGYGPDSPTNPSSSPNPPITKSVAIKFDLVNNAGEGTNSTGLYISGASPTIPAVTIGGGVNLRSGHIFQVHMRYDGTALTMTITDTTNTAQTFTTSWTVNIPSTVGGSTAYVGFTGGTGRSVANQDIATWTYGN